MGFVKKNIKLIIVILIGIILISGISVYAVATYFSNQVIYKDGKTVEQALNELYNKKIKILKIGDYNSKEDREIDIKEILPNNYSKLKKDNFVIMNASIDATSSNSTDAENNIIGSYDAQNGKLSLNKCLIKDTSYYIWVKYSIGCIIGEVEIVNDVNTGNNEEEEPVVNPMAGFGEVKRSLINDFGKQVTSGYSVKSNSGVTDPGWRLFYADNNYAYLIANSIGTKALNSIDGFSTATISELGRNLNSKFTSWSAQAANENIKSVASLLDTTKWEAYKGENAVWAIGGPSIEMFVASFNATHSASKYQVFGTTSMQIGCNVLNASDTGYKLNINGGDYTDTITGVGNDSSIDIAIYCAYNGYYWIASPSALGNDIVIYSRGNYGYGLTTYWGGTNGYTNSYNVRPVVAVPVSLIGTQIILGSI